MANFGLYTIDSDDSFTLMFNGRRITTISSIVNKAGVTVDGNKMKFHGVDIAASAMQHPYVYPKDDNLYFGEVPLLPSGECINITKDDYNSLISGEIIDGYTRYSQQAIYNIVADVSNAPTIHYTVDNGVITFDNGTESRISSDMIYNSVGGELPHNNEDFTATVDNIDFPFLCLKHFDPIIPVGGHIDFTYHVDTRDMARLNYDTIDRTFTVVVETEGGSVAKKTTYAGVFTFSTPTFNTAGETWFSVRCIDSRGVSSATQYFDILVRNAVQYNTYNMVAADLQPFTYNGETYQIVPNDNTVSTALANKAALSAFFAKVKDGGYNRVVMLNNIYWVDYHNKNMAPRLGGDNIVFPNNFTIDLNGSTIRVTQCTDLSEAELIDLRKNVDTHIVNGSIKGNYEGFDFASTAANIGLSTEWLHVVDSHGSRFCSFENLDISNAVGYDSAIEAINAGSYLIPAFSVGGINPQTGELDSTKDSMVVSNLMTINNAYLNLGELALGKFGQMGYWAGDKREYFMSFYDESNAHIKTIKSKMYYEVKIPVGAKKVRVSGYGTTTQWQVNAGNGPYVMLHERSKNIEFKNCHWHDTRTAAIAPIKVKGLSYKDCVFEDIGLEHGTYQVTALLGDFEDGWQWVCDVYINGCKCIVNDGKNGSNALKIKYCNNFDFEGNQGIHIWVEAGGLESGFEKNNTFPSMRLERGYRSYHPNVLYDSNVIGTLTVTDEGNVVEPLTMINTTITNYCSYSRLHLKNSKNGTLKFD